MPKVVGALCPWQELRCPAIRDAFPADHDRKSTMTNDLSPAYRIVTVATVLVIECLSISR